MLSFFPLDVLNEIWDLIESVSGGFFTYSQMQTEKSQPEGKRIMQETRLTEFPALSVDEIIVEEQAGFRAKRSTTERIFNLKSCVKSTSNISRSAPCL